MAKNTGKLMTLTIGGNAITCLQSVETDERTDVYAVSCAQQQRIRKRSPV